jgi:hypothetical protein
MFCAGERSLLLFHQRCRIFAMKGSDLRKFAHLLSELTSASILQPGTASRRRRASPGGVLPLPSLTGWGNMGKGSRTLFALTEGIKNQTGGEKPNDEYHPV